ncbi:MAG: thiamine pyrophosphate-dependent dehydrogenase E1 component subunit alpha, partial [Spirochaetia bacterium]
MSKTARKTGGGTAGTTSYDPAWLLGLYRAMVLIRQFEDRVKFLFLEGVMPGTIHQYQGQEACGVGVCAALNPDDVITTTHRPHGHCIAKGLDVRSAMAELFGKVTGCCKGKGGSMHMGDLSKGIVPAIAIVGGGLPLTTGMALAFKMRKEARVAVGFMGDGATNEGAFHEAVNMAAIWDLPVLFVVENNFYGASTHVSKVVKTPHISDRAAAYGITGLTVDGNDVLAVFEAARAAVARARDG